MKKLLILTIIIFLGLVGLSFYFLTGSKSERSPTGGILSERAREYLRERRSDNRRWSRLAVQDRPPAHQVLGGQQVRVGDCFEFEIPFPIESMKNKGKCFNLFRISSPSGRIAAYWKQVSARALEELPEVQMRRLKNNVYIEEKRVLGRQEFIIFQKKGSHYQKTAFQLAGGRLFVLSFIVYNQGQANDFDSRFMRMLSSLEFLADRPGGRGD